MAMRGKALDVEKIARELIYVEKERNGDTISYGGWKRKLLVDKSITKSEEKLLICTLCRGVLRDALVVDVFEKKEPRCCVCLPPNHGFLNTHDIIRSVVDERKVHCPVLHDGCRWEGPLSNLLAHLNECVVLAIPCPFGCLIDSEKNSLATNSSSRVRKIRRNKLENHLTSTCPMRVISCEYCHSQTEACNINSHLSNCEEFPIECHNLCTTSNNGEIGEEQVYKDKRKNILDHMYTDCPLQEILCPYSLYGCETVVLRKDLEMHKFDNFFMQQHLEMVEARLKEVTTVEAGDIALLSSISLSDIGSNELHGFGGIEWKVFDYRKKITKNFECRSPPFYSSGYKFRFYLTLLEKSWIGSYIEMLEGEYDSKLLWPLSCEFTLKLMNKSGNGDLVHEFRSDKFHDQRAFKRPKPTTSNIPFGYELISIAEIKSRRFSLDGSLLFRFFVKCF